MILPMCFHRPDRAPSMQTASAADCQKRVRSGHPDSCQLKIPLLESDKPFKLGKLSFENCDKGQLPVTLNDRIPSLRGRENHAGVLRKVQSRADGAVGN